jgi:uncharacterized protein (UPF0548 family)
MILALRQPTAAAVRRLLADQQARPFTYPYVGATQGTLPRGYSVDHNRIRLGAGPDAWDAAVAALRRWEMFHIPWMRLYWPDTPIEVGRVVAISSVQFGFWTLNACRIVYLRNDDGPVRRYGFAYGTLPAHVARGEERFTVEWHQADDSVWYDILAISQPRHPLARLGYPVARLVQRRFARDSRQAMRRAVRQPRPGALASQPVHEGGPCHGRSYDQRQDPRRAPDQA